MSTKYILVGGYLHKASDNGRAFCEELVKGINSKPVKILDCMFARPKESWEEKINEDNVLFAKYVKNFDLILADPKKFIEQMKTADVIFLRGGDTNQLIKMLDETGNWIKELDGKTLAGASAGAEVISKYNYGLDSLEMENGKDLLPIKLIVHYESDYNSPNIDWVRAYRDLKNYKEDLPVYKLREGEFVVINSHIL